MSKEYQRLQEETTAVGCDIQEIQENCCVGSVAERCGAAAEGQRGLPASACYPGYYQSGEKMLRDTRPFSTRKMTEVQLFAF